MTQISLILTNLLFFSTSLTFSKIKRQKHDKSELSILNLGLI